MNRRAAFAAAALAVIALGAAIGLRGAPEAERVGYFKSPEGERVIAFRAPGPLGAAEARALLEAAPATEGRASAALLYSAPAAAPGDELTLAPDLAAALALVGPEGRFPDWSHRLRVNPAGERTFDSR